MENIASEAPHTRVNMRKLHYFFIFFAAILGVYLSGCSDDTVPYDKNGNEGEDHDKPVEDAVAGQNPSTGLGTFPNDLYSVEDSERLTGRTVTFNYDAVESAGRWSDIKQSIANQIEGLDGFGTSAGAWIGFTERIDDITQEEADAHTFLGYFEGEDLVETPTNRTVTRYQISLRPDLPIPPNREAFFFATTDIRSNNGNPVVQDPTLKAILAGEDKDGADAYDEALQDRIRETADRIVEEGHVDSTDKLAALSVFTTQSIYETDTEVAEYIRNLDQSRNYDVNAQSNNDCVNVGGESFRFCTFTFEVPNFISEDRTIPDDAVDHIGDNYVLTAHAYIPLAGSEHEDAFDIVKDPENGYAINIFGHGLGSSASSAKDIARHTAQQGIATVSIDAPIHGDHPLRPDDVDPTEELDVILALFGLTVEGSEASINAQVLRDGWRHSNFDKLALIEALKTGIDLDDDGVTDLDIERLTYLGGSLGAIQGSEFAALTDVPRADLFAVAGGRLSDIIRHGGLFKFVNKLLFPRQSDDSMLQIFIMLQTSLEKGDGINWAAHVLNDRIQSGDGYLNDRIPDVAVQISVPDVIVPPESGMALARALGVDGIGTGVLEDPLISFDNLVLQGNHTSGATAGILQTDCVRRREPEDPWIESEHGKSADSVEGIKYWTDALLSILGPDADPNERMELRDPYTELGIVRGESCEDTYIP